jgi:hypothetical protein
VFSNGKKPTRMNHFIQKIIAFLFLKWMLNNILQTFEIQTKNSGYGMVKTKFGQNLQKTRKNSLDVSGRYLGVRFQMFTVCSTIIFTITVYQLLTGLQKLKGYFV